ncbi:hypothetical protein ACFWBB_10980 [Streptomyces sp. NPDC060000]|uniref:hypothetical protein n=1 Tax=Streptomyces sp. NPDC060000 TaxID=3347031 RepID=UPI0036BBC5EA
MSSNSAGRPEKTVLHNLRYEGPAAPLQDTANSSLARVHATNSRPYWQTDDAQAYGRGFANDLNEAGNALR